jgi:hypothetical protein
MRFGLALPAHCGNLPSFSLVECSALLVNFGCLQLRAVLDQFHALSWLTASPTVGAGRTSTLPVHVCVLTRLAAAVAGVPA